jgi:preprotein translocase subunit SecF
MQILNNANYNFLRWKWHAIALSAVVILAGIGMIAVKGMPLGIDFSGGTLIVVQFDQPTTEAQVRDAVAPLPGEEVVQQYGDASERRLLIRLPQVEGAVEGNSLEQGSAAVEQALTKAGLPKFTIVKRELVSAVIGRRPAAARHLRDARVAGGNHHLHRHPASGSRSPSARSPPRCTTCW